MNQPQLEPRPRVIVSEEEGVNIDAAEEVLRRAEASAASIEEVNEMIKTLQGVQNDEGVDHSKIRKTLAGLIAARTVLEG